MSVSIRIMTRRAVVLILVLHLQLAKIKGPDLPQFARAGTASINREDFDWAGTHAMCYEARDLDRAR